MKTGRCGGRAPGVFMPPGAAQAAAAVHGGTEPDLLDEFASWQTDDFWQYAMFAAVACIRAPASRAGVPVRQACKELAGDSGRPAP